MCRCISSRVTAAVSAVIVRLDRTIQYSGTLAMERIGRGVLGPPLSRRTTAVGWAGFCRQGATPTRGQEQKRSASLPLLRHCDFRAFSSKTRAVALSGNEPSMVLAETLRSVATRVWQWRFAARCSEFGEGRRKPFLPSRFRLRCRPPFSAGCFFLSAPERRLGFWPGHSGVRESFNPSGAPIAVPLP